MPDRKNINSAHSVRVIVICSKFWNDDYLR